MKLQMAVFIFSNILELYGLKCQPKVQKYGITGKHVIKTKTVTRGCILEQQGSNINSLDSMVSYNSKSGINNKLTKIQEYLWNYIHST